jgi:uncharacterized protein (TIGR03435 family)
MLRTGFCFGIIFFAIPAHSQVRPTVAPYTFEVSTVKPSPPDQRDFWFRYRGPGVYEANNHTIRECIARFFDVFPGLVSGGPGWLDSDRYLITAKLPNDVRPSPGELNDMFQVLLAERFKLKVHRESRMVPVYLLEVAKKGFKLPESTEPGDESLTIVVGQITARRATMRGFAAFIQRLVMDRAVIDRTALKGKYDFELIWNPDESQFGGKVRSGLFEDRPDLYQALDAFGLKLQTSRAMVDVLVIDSVERPDEN